VAFGFYVVPDVLDFSVGADQERTAHDSQERFPQEFLHPARSVRLDHLEIRIAQQREIQLVLFLEARLRLDGIAAGPQDGHIHFLKLLLCVTKLGRFDRSTRGIGLRKEKQNHAFPAKIRKRYVLAFVTLGLEIRSLIASFQHRQSPRSSRGAL